MFDPIEMHELGPVREDRQRFDLPAMRQSPAVVAVKLGGVRSMK